MGASERTPPARGRPRRAIREWSLPLALWVQFLAVGAGATPFRHSGPALAAIGLLYALLALLLFLGARFAMQAGRAWGAAACLALALVPAAQLRMDADRLQGPAFLALFLLAAGGAAYALLRPAARGARRASPARLLQAYGALFALVGAVVLAARASAEVRWHLLKHHRLFGGPLYALSSRPLRAEREVLWSRRGRLSDPRERGSVAGEAKAVFAPPPHVIFLMIDTLRADALTALGGRHAAMPALDRRAERSFLFGDVRSSASWTRAACASIFTGLLPEEHGAARFHERLSEHWLTLPERMAAAGYQTAAFVSNWVQVGRETGFAQGFAEGDFHELMSGDEILARAGTEAQSGEVRGAYARAEAVNRAALEWLAGPARDPYRPAFLYLHYLDPHSPYLEPPEPGTLGDPRARKRGLYRQELRYLDRHLEAFLQDLEEVLSGPKVIVLTSDHGEEFFEHDDWGHGHSLYREVLWVPLLVQMPDGRAGRSEAALETRDLYELLPTIAAEPALDLAAWARTHARALRYASQYLDREEDARADRKWTGLRRIDGDGWGLIWSAFGPTLELYDLGRDPGELENRIDREAERAARLERELEQAVRFWVAPTVVERSAEELEFLRALGYVGGVDPPARPGAP